MSLEDLVRRALAEDRADHDVTTIATVPEATRGRARLIAKQSCVVAGMEPFALAFTLLDPELRVSVKRNDGTRASVGEAIATVEGPLRAILSAERTALNFAQRLSGTATLTAEFVARAHSAVLAREATLVEGAARAPDHAARAPGDTREVALRDTRKTTPGMRALEKAAVRAGGGTNHRETLADAILIKDNHIVAAGGIELAVKSAKETGRPVEVECDTLDQVRAAVEAGADEVLLDNMDAKTLRAAVELVDGRAHTEASGGITLDNVGDIAATGVDAISVGALTHSAPAVDLSLEIEAI